MSDTAVGLWAVAISLQLVAVMVTASTRRLADAVYAISNAIDRLAGATRDRQ